MKIAKLNSGTFAQGVHYVALISPKVANRPKWKAKLSDILPHGMVTTKSAGCTHTHEAILHADAEKLRIPVVARAYLNTDKI